MLYSFNMKNTFFLNLNYVTIYYITMNCNLFLLVTEKRIVWQIYENLHICM